MFLKIPVRQWTVSMTMWSVTVSFNLFCCIPEFLSPQACIQYPNLFVCSVVFHPSYVLFPIQKC